MRKQEEGTNVVADEYWFERLVGSRGLFLTPCSVSEWKSEIQSRAYQAHQAGTGLPSLVLLLLICNVCVVARSRGRANTPQIRATAGLARGTACSIWSFPA
jgi:hypothetical protein